FGDTLVTVMIESRTAMEHLPAILAVDGLDAAVIGLSDLASSLGHPGENQHPEVRRAAERIIATVRSAKRAVPGYNLHHWAQERDLIPQRLPSLTLHPKTMLNRRKRDLFALVEVKR